MATISEQVEAALHQSLPQAWQSEIQGTHTMTFEACPSITDTDTAILAMGILSKNLNTLLGNLFEKTSVIELMLYAASGNPSLKGILLSSLQLNDAMFSCTVTPTVFEYTRQPEPDANYRVDFAFEGFGLAEVTYQFNGAQGVAAPGVMIGSSVSFGDHPLSFTATYCNGKTETGNETITVLDPAEYE